MEPFIGQIMMVGFNFAPRGWAFCHGQLLPIVQYQALFSLLGVTYGGNGTSTFALPDLRGRCAVGMGQAPGLQNVSQGEVGGVEQVTLTHQQMPAHTHQLMVSDTDGSQNSPSNAMLAKGNVTIARGNTVPANLYAQGTPTTAMNPQSIQIVGGNTGHENRQPYLGMNYIIALEGIFPSRN